MEMKGAWVVGDHHHGGGDSFLGIISEANSRNTKISWSNGDAENFPTAEIKLCIFDLAPTGVTHEGVRCDACDMFPILGMRWKCIACSDYDLCSMCYHGNMHETTHAFHRICLPGSNPVSMSTRRMYERKKIYGFFPGARVKRGRDWEWGNQDGGDGNYGKVISSYGWKGPFGKKHVRSGVSVLWDKQSNQNNYRTGFQGKMDLLCVKGAFGGYYYKQHLPSVGSVLKETPQKREKRFNVGDSVTICKGLQTLIQLQDGHGGFMQDMIKVIGKVGHVVEIVPTGDVLVMFSSDDDPVEDLFQVLLQGVALQRRRRWLFNALALRKVEAFAVNERVKVINDPDLVKLMQKNIGVYRDNLELLNNEEGVVVKPFDGESVQVKFGDRLLVAMSAGAIVKYETVLQNVLSDLLNACSQSIQDESNKESSKGVSEKPKEKNIVRLASEGDYDGIKNILSEKPYMINTLLNGKSALHMALVQGNSDIVQFLINNGADLTLQSSDGETVLHFAASSNMFTVGRQLIRHKVDMNVKNKFGSTALHIAIQKENDLFVRTMISEKCNPNVKDGNGNAPLHLAIEKKNLTIVEILLSAISPNCDVNLKDRNGFNALHLAISKGELDIVKAILEESPESINIVKSDGFSPLHLAVLHGSEEITNFLLSFNQDVGVDVYQTTNTGQSAFHLACIEGFMGIVKALLEVGADINQATPEGDTAVHLCIRKHMLLRNLPQQLQGFELYPDIATVKSHFDNRQASGIVVACFLIENGASLTYLNGQGQSCIDCCEDHILKKLLIEFGEKHSKLEEHSKVSRAQSQNEETLDTCKMCDSAVEGRFHPCGHAVACLEHAECMRKCPECMTVIAEVTRVSVERLPNCVICRDVRVNMTFQPCGHQIACYECGKRFRRCLSCDADIETKVPICDVPGATAAANDGDSLDSNEANLCNICFEQRRNTSFMCGHGACKKCAYALRDCHVCRRRIDKIIPLYTD